jgi:type III pantothenate kinase
MLLVIDIGNSNVVWGLFRQQSLTGPWRLVTDQSRTAKEYGSDLIDQLRSAGLAPAQIADVILCSVVPPLTPVFEQMADTLFHRKPLVASSDLDTGLTLLSTNPRELGADRLVTAAAAYDRYKTALIVVDLGTATTFSVVTQSGEYLGGVIAPGVGISAKALADKTAQLPVVDLVPPKVVVGRDTRSSIQSGLLFGHASLVDGIVTRIEDELGQKVLVVATGGFAPLISPISRTIQEVRPHLTLEGLELLHRRTGRR